MTNHPRNQRTPPKRVFFAAGAGDAIKAHHHWLTGEQDPEQVSITFSSQVEQYCNDIGADLYIVGYKSDFGILQDGSTKIEYISKKIPNASGAAYHLREAFHGLRLLVRAVRYRPDVALIESGCTQYFMQGLFSIFGIRVVPILHNALWPYEKKPSNISARLIQTLDGLFWRYGPAESLCVSPVSANQIRELGGPNARPTRQFRAQFNADFFAPIKPLPPYEQRPFRINYVGRIVASKGVFHLLQIARALEDERPGTVKWTICGSGPDLENLRNASTTAGLDEVVTIKGWTAPAEQIAIYSSSHCSIVPSIETEGLPMSAIESLLAGRPILASDAALTLDALSAASVVCQRGDVASYIKGIKRLLDDPKFYHSLARNCRDITEPFVDLQFGLTQALKDSLGDGTR
ncbi:glycosyltransferase family 4 protein [Hyphococcus lacteus]|uniref:Glycosyltransferase family 4 protein n=1 Tax=Hyphococcus lacteus TaxID=3143536 RepID=A0ABV3Z594_9PROT